MLPYTDGTIGEPDSICIDAIKENEEVIERQLERLGLLRVEVELRGLNWREFFSNQEVEEQEENEVEGETNGDMVDGSGNLVNGFRHGPHHGNATPNVASQGTNGLIGSALHTGGEPIGSASASLTAGTTGSGALTSGTDAASPWTDGTFTTGTITNGNVSFGSQPLVVNRIPPMNSQTSNLTEQLQMQDISRLEAHLRQSRADVEELQAQMERTLGIADEFAIDRQSRNNLGVQQTTRDLVRLSTEARDSAEAEDEDGVHL